MSDLGLALGVLKVSLELWQDVRAKEFQKQFMRLEEELRDEQILGENSSDKRIDDLEHELRTLTASFVYATSTGK